jgi:hypothetical protein
VPTPSIPSATTIPANRHTVFCIVVSFCLGKSATSVFYHVYDVDFLPPEVADRYFVELRDKSAWEQKKAAFGNMQPRLTASYGDDLLLFRHGEQDTPVDADPA